MDSESPNRQAGDALHQTNEGAHVTGDVATGGGDFVGHDQHIYGDLVRGDKVIHQTLSEAELQDQNNRRVLRQLVTKFWIEGVLAHSLNHEVAIRLNIADHSQLVESHLWKLIPQQAAEPARLLPLDTHIIDVFDQMNQRLLILGEPGAGKTTLLLELARALLKRADETLAYPSPVVFNLSSWVQRKLPLTDWMVDELGIRYNIPKRVAQAWVAQDKLLPLLDGLDEVQLEHRTACAQAVNHFHQEHLVPLVVCSRTVEYEQLTVRLKLQGAVLLQPLTTDQIAVYLNRAGPTLAAVRTTLQHDTELEELAHSPLTLSIMALAYQNVTLAELNLTDATQTRRQHLFNAYIQRMFVRREIAPIYSASQTLRWLQWLASRLVQSGQTIFLIERMQPSWLQTSGQKPSRMSLIMLLVGPIYGLISGLSYGLLGNLPGGLIFGLIFGLIDGLNGRFRTINPIEQSSVLKRKLTSSLYATLFWGLFFGLSYALIRGRAYALDGELSDGLDDVLSFALVGGPIFGLSGGLIGGFREIELVRQPGWSWQRIKSNLFWGLITGLSGGLFVWLFDGLSVGLSVGLVDGLIFGPLGGLLGGLIGALVFQPSTGTDIPISVETQRPNQGIRSSARYSLIASLIFGLSIGLSIGLLGGLISGLSYGLSYGLFFGLLGGGDMVMRHCILRIVLWWKRDIPWNYARFLDYATALIFLRKVGGGYIFVHRLVMEHFATLDEQAIERITTPSNFR